MDIEIPDKIYKLLVLLGAIIIGYSEIQLSNDTNNWGKDLDKITSERNLFELEKISTDFEFIKTETSVDYYSDIVEKSNEQKIKNIYIDSLLKLRAKLLLLKKSNAINSKRVDHFSNKFKILKEDLTRINETRKALQKIGIILFSLGILMWMIDETKVLQILHKQNEKLYPWCQSCGKKFSSIIKYGTNKDSTSNYAFCKNCYTKGKFNNPNLTKDEFLEHVKNEISSKSWWSKIILMDRFNTLERWNDNKY